MALQVPGLKMRDPELGEVDLWEPLRQVDQQDDCSETDALRGLNDAVGLYLEGKHVRAADVLQRVPEQGEGIFTAGSFR